MLLVCLTSASIASAQTVHLPAIRQFSYSGSVLVPDRGSAILGGTRSAAMASSSRGVPGVGAWPGGRSRSSQASAGGISVSATIIDLDQIDRQILGYDPRQAMRVRHKGAGFVSSAAEIAEAKSLVRNARQVVSQGQRETAKHLYGLAIEKLGRHPEAGALLAYARAEFVGEFGEKAGCMAARRRPSELDIVTGRLRPSELTGVEKSRRSEPSVDYDGRIGPAEPHESSRSERVRP